MSSSAGKAAPSLKPLVISCGGTGGHFYPGLAIAREAARQGRQVQLHITGQHTLAQLAVARSFGLETQAGLSAKLPRSLLEALRFSFVFPAAILQSLWRLLCRRPAAVLLMGSFAGAPLGLACWLLRIPLHLHEGNALIGKANRTLSPFARRLMLSFPAVNQAAIRCPMLNTGMPVRPEIEAAASSPAAGWPDLLARAGLLPSIPTILVTGGSQGARVLNTRIAASIAQADRVQAPLQVIHLAGKGQSDAVRSIYAPLGARALVLDYCEDMSALLHAASLVICRSGASTLAELALFGKPAILIPFPFAAENHQHENALLAAQNDGAILLPENAFDEAAFIPVLQALLADEARLQALTQGMRSLARHGAAAAALAAIEGA